MDNKSKFEITQKQKRDITYAMAIILATKTVVVAGTTLYFLLKEKDNYLNYKEEIMAVKQKYKNYQYYDSIK